MNASLALLDGIVSNSRDAILVTEAWPVDRPGPQIVYVNEAFIWMTGYTREEVIGNTPRILHGPGTDRVRLDEIRAALDRLEPVRTELLNYRKDGTRFWVEVDIVPVDDEQGNHTHWVSIQRDVTDRKRQQEALRESEERLRTILVQYASDLITILDADGTIRYESLAIERLLGYKPEELVGANILDYVHPKDASRVASELEAIRYAPGVSDPVEARLRHKSGSWIWLEGIGNNLLDDPSVGGIVINSRDITWRKLAQERLAEAENRYRSIAESVREVVFETDAEGNYTFLNAAWEEITGFTVEESLGKSYLEFIHPDDLQRNLEDFDSMGEHGGDYTEYEARYLTKDGSPRDVEIKFREHLDDSGNLTGISGTVNDITERKQTERERQESERRFRQLFEQSVDAIYVHDKEGNFVDCNTQACNLLGYTREELLSMSVRDVSCNVLTEEERSRQQEEGGTLWQRTLSGEPGVFSHGHEEENVRKDGTTFPVEVWVGSVDYGGQRMVLASVRDITERKENEAALRESRDLLQAVMEGTTDVVFVKDTKGYYLMINPAGAELVGKEVQEVIGKDDIALFAADDAEQVMAKDREIMTTGETQSYEDHKEADGVGRTYLVTRGPYRDHQGNVLGVFGVSRDMTERKQTENELQESEQRFRGAFDYTSTGMALVSLDNYYLRVNRALCDLLGYTEEEFLSMRTFDITHPEDQVKSRDRTRRVLGEESPGATSIEKRYLKKDGGVLWALSDASLVRDAGGQPSHFISHFQDITERKNLEERLLHQALHDPLTGLPNRSSLHGRFERVIQHLSNPPQRRSENVLEGTRYMAILFLDLDGFKELNDSLGHAAGDEILRAVSERLRNLVRPGDTVARLGGDEFCVLLSGVSSMEETVQIAERVKDAVDKPFSASHVSEVTESPAGASSVILSTSIGIAVSRPTEAGKTLDELLREADAAMYRAKKRGGALYELVDLTEDTG